MSTPSERASRIFAYFESCNSGTPAQIAAHFSDDAVIYDTNHAPVRTAVGIGEFWERIRAQWDGAVWTVDRVVSDGDTAAIEWQMAGTSAAGTADARPFVFRGSEHYSFSGPLISEIRQYWHLDQGGLNTGLVGYPYPDKSDIENEGTEDNH